MANISESVLVESRTARDSQLKNLSQERAEEILNKVKSLYFALWQGVGVATTEQMAEFYEVHLNTVRATFSRSKDKEEFLEDGLREIRGKELKALQSIGHDNMQLPDSATRLTAWTPRSALRLAMRLSGSEVARAVRTSLLDAAEYVIPAQVQSTPAQLTPHQEIECIDKLKQLLSDLCGGLEDRDKLLLSDLARNVGLKLQGAQPLLPAAEEITISDRVVALGYRPARKQLLNIGRIASRLYQDKHRKKPSIRTQYVDGAPRKVKSYCSSDLDIVDAAIQRVMGKQN